MWYPPVATTTWSAVQSPAEVEISKIVLMRRTPLTLTPSRSGGSNDAAYASRYATISSFFMNPCGSGPGYGKPGRRHCQLGVTKQKLSQRRARHSWPSRFFSNTT